MYKGMQWSRCDLQMQTPGDYLNWLEDDPCFLGGEYTPEELVESVDLYLHTCHKAGLNIIGVTDHNFIGRKYLAKLIERNEVVASKLEKDPLIIFPGFEIEISQGKGLHFLCLFDPSTSLQVIDDKVTSLGLPNDKRTENRNISPANISFDDLIQIVQEDKDNGGVVIAAHPLAESGILNDKFLTDHFQKFIFTDSRLLAIEIPKYINELSAGWQTLLKSKDDCHPDWRRRNPIATLMSSDCYSLKNEDKGFIGKRSSWIKMSQYSIEALRQALLDHQSRILLQKDHPESTQTYGKIKSIKINNVAFLSDQTIYLSPNFNCIIGGRGSGKSSILEYIRLCTKQNIDEDKHSNLKRIKNTLSQNSNLELEWEDLGGNDKFKFDPSLGSVEITSREEVDDPGTILKRMDVQIYSQREITDLATNTEDLLPIIDKITGEDLITLDRTEETIKDKIKVLQQEKYKLNRKVEERQSLKQEISELQRQWDSFESVKKENELKQEAQRTSNYIKKIEKAKEEVIGKISSNLEDVNQRINYSLSEEEKLLDEDFCKKIETSSKKLQDDLVEEINASILNYQEHMDSLIINCEPVISRIEEIKFEFREACQRANIHPDQLEMLAQVDRDKNLKEQRLNDLNAEIDELLIRDNQLNEEYSSLYTNWKNQTEKRSEKIKSILNNDSIPKVSSVDKPFIQIDITHMADAIDFQRHWNEVKVSKATKLGKNWDLIGEELFKDFIEDNSSNSPWELLDNWLQNEDLVPAQLKDYYEQLIELFADKSLLDRLLISRIKDQINITLFREDGSKAGSILDNGLSDGQKNTAILTLLFAEGTNPIVIDQPEDELDSDFIYNQLVPLIRNIKNERQIIVISHNANLPVNADAELVHALKTDSGQGKVRTQGGIDNTEVRNAILDIMEGSAEAFRKRREKYYL
ncbi:TrlF family AAA-like ATPase [Staphylococcus saprophyticus]|uniref:TrlF family AAA-like ATPase n=2 Tax=Staphylococcus TaxID=1279 RepID=UPI0028A0BA82|nr:AAA family ATPase [Staphylococcus saprophyticus]